MAEYPIIPPVDPEAERCAAELALLESQITAALESAPRFAIPADFAARVATYASQHRSAAASRLQAARYPSVQLTARHHGRNAAIVSLCVLLAMIAFFAPRSVGPSVLWISIETVFCLQFALLAVWLVALPYLPIWDAQR